MSTALIIGATDGIGLAVTGRLLDHGWTVTGMARRDAAIEHPRYRHHRIDVRAPGYRDALVAACAELGAIDACIYCAGIGEELDLAAVDAQRPVFEVNLMGAVIAVEIVLPLMLAAGRGHVIGLSSQADALRDPGAPAYAASKAGLSSYLEALALAVRPRGVHVTTIRFGFVATRLQPEPMPFQISIQDAAEHVVRCLSRRPIRSTRPRRLAALLWLLCWTTRIRLWLT